MTGGSPSQPEPIGELIACCDLDEDRARHNARAFGFQRWYTNYRELLEWVLDGRLVVDPLRTHVLPPEACQEAYDGVIHRRDEYLGVVFDWTGA